MSIVFGLSLLNDWIGGVVGMFMFAFRFVFNSVVHSFLDWVVVVCLSFFGLDCNYCLVVGGCFVCGYCSASVCVLCGLVVIVVVSTCWCVWCYVWSDYFLLYS